MEQERLISEFNEAKFQIFRLHNLWLECKHFRESGMLLNWKWKLDTAEIELYEDAKHCDKQDKKGFLQRIKEINKVLDSLDGKKTKQAMNLFYNKLKEKELLLREIKEASGKGSRWRSEEEDGM